MRLKGRLHNYTPRIQNFIRLRRLNKKKKKNVHLCVNI